MILLECSNCGQTLNVDDAFAGGVCRCRHCGTIQTVPADAPRLDESVAAAGGKGVEAAPVVGGSRPLYRREEQRSDGETSGLEDLADAVLSSGMLSSGLSRGGRRTPHKSGRNADAKAGPDRRIMLLIAAVAVLALVAAGLALALLDDDDNPGGGTTTVPLFGLPLDGSVAIVLDRGRSTADSFEDVGELVLAAIDTLPPGTDFQVILWERPDLDDRPVALPGRRMRAVSEAARRDVERGLREAVVGGTTEVNAAFDLAVANQPDTIVVITGKGRDLLGGWADTLLDLRAAGATTDGQGARVHALAVDPEAGGDAPELRRLARETGGLFRGVTPADVRRALDERPAVR